MRHNFERSLKLGQAGETAFLAVHPGLQKLSGYQSDFINPTTGETWELKTDQYDINRTANIFLERWSDFHKRKPGGVFQALEHKSQIWAYFFIKNNVYFKFDTAALAAWLEDNSHKYKEKHIENNGWLTVGYAVPRDHIKHLYIEVRL